MVIWNLIFFHKGYSISHFTHTNSTQGFQFLHILTNTCYHFLFNIIAIATEVRWYIIVVLICISLVMLTPFSHATFMLANCMSSLEKCQFRFFLHFLNQLFVVVVLLLSCRSSLYILDLISYLLYDLKYFSHSVLCTLPFHLVNCFLCCTEASKFDYLGSFAFVTCAFDIICKKIIA